MAQLSRLLQALEDNPRTRTIPCPRTGLMLRIRCPTRKDKREAAAAAAERWGERSLRNRMDLAEYHSVNREELLARCVAIQGDAAPIGLEGVDAYDEETLGELDAVLQELEQKSDPDADTWTEEDVRAFVEAVKKKELAIEDFWTTLPSSRRLGLLRSLVALLPSCDMSSSPMPTSDSSPSAASSRP